MMMIALLTKRSPKDEATWYATAARAYAQSPVVLGPRYTSRIRENPLTQSRVLTAGARAPCKTPAAAGEGQIEKRPQLRAF
jgi:hypothetical protein